MQSAVEAVDRADKADGAAINMNAAWREARATILAGRDAKSLDAAATAAVGLIVSVGDGSKLILDPDLDSYYVMDTLITKLPGMADNAGRAGDLQTVVTAKDTLDQRIALAGAQGALRATTAAMGSGLQTAFKNTADAGAEARAERRRGGGLRARRSTSPRASTRPARARSPPTTSRAARPRWPRSPRCRRSPRRAWTRCWSRAWTSSPRRACRSP